MADRPLHVDAPSVMFRRSFTPCAILAATVSLATGATIARVATASAYAAIVRFRTPSGLVVCGSTRFPGQLPILRCNGPLNPAPPRPRTCEYEWAVGLSMYSKGRASVVCASDSGFDPHHAPVLAYGRAWHRFGFTCTAQRSGLTCSNLSHHGWFMSRNRWRAF
jgi:hypothetical protein